MDILKCNNCGAKINKRSLQCDYCGTHYKKAGDGYQEEMRRQHSYIIPKLSREHLIESMKHLNAGSLVMLAPILFMCLWCSIAAGMGIFSLASGTPFAVAIVPFGMATVGLVVLINLIKNTIKDSIRKIIRLFESGKTEEAYNLAKQKGLKNQSALLISLLLAYHVFNDYDYLEQNAIRVTDSAINSTTNYTNDYCIIVEKYTAIK